MPAKRKWEHGEVFEYEQILESRLSKKGRREYFVKWRNWDHKFNSWEPEKFFDAADLEKFESGADAPTGDESGAERVACRPSLGMKQGRSAAAGTLGRKECGGEVRHEMRGVKVDVKAALFPEIALALFWTCVRLTGLPSPEITVVKGRGFGQLIIMEQALIDRLIALQNHSKEFFGALRLKGGRIQNDDLFCITMPMAVTVRYPAKNKKGDVRDCDDPASLYFEYNISKVNGKTGELFSPKAKKSEVLINTTAQRAEITKYVKATLKAHYPAHPLVRAVWCKRGAPAVLPDETLMPAA